MLKTSLLLLNFLFLFFSTSNVTKAQSNDSLNTKKEVIFYPDWIISVDLLNIIDRYPSILLGVEKKCSDLFSVMLEGGPSLQAEWGEENFNRYIGFKSRIELKLYFGASEHSYTKGWLGMDVGYRHDEYESDYSIFQTNFTELKTGVFTRSLVSSHFRVGFVKYIAQQVPFMFSLGLGRVFSSLSTPEPNVQSDSFISEPSTISANLRFKIAFPIAKK